MTDPLSELNIQQFNLSSGDSIIGLIKSISGTLVVVEKPLSISRSVSNGMEAHYFSVYMPLSESNMIKINYSNIVAMSDVSDEIKEKYIRTCLDDDADETEDTDDVYSDDEIEIPTETTVIKNKTYH